MTPRTRLLAALTAALVPLAPGLTPAAMAFTPVSELKDVTPDHWAYAAIQSLIEKYEVMEGFPDKSFRGPKTLTRYEMAAALAKVMAKVEELIASATGNPISVDPGVNPEDLRTIARLQREFRDEMEVLKGRVDMIDTRVQTIEKRVRTSGEIRNEYRSYLGAAPAARTPFDEVRVRSRMNLDAALADELSAHTSLFWDVYGPQSVGAAYATNGSTTSPWTEMYASKAYVSYTPGGWAVHTGLGNVSDMITLGSTLKNPFTQNVWREGLGGYGFVGTPGLNLNAPADSIARMTPGGLSANSNPVWWLTGTDVASQALDPNATQAIAPRGNYTAAASGEAGPFSLGLALYSPGLAGRDIARLGSLSYPSSLPQPETFDLGQRMVTTVGADFGFVRAQIAARTPGLIWDDLGLFNKTLTGTVDIGSDALGFSFQTVARSALTGQFTPSQASMTLASNDLFGTGFGLGLGLNSGTVLDTSLANGRTTFAQAATPKSLAQFLAGTDYNSYGLALRLPGFSIFPNLSLAAQQTAGPNFTGTIASGLTLQADVKLWQLPLMQVEYSSGKFDPGVVDAAKNNEPANGLLNNAAQASHELLSIQMVVPY